MKIPCYFQVRAVSSCATVQTGLWRCLDAPQCLEASALQLSGRLSYTVHTLGQATLSSTRSWISNDTIWEGFARRLDDVATSLDATQCSRIFEVSFTDAERSDNIDRPDSQSICLDAVLFWEKLRYSGKAVTKDRPDVTRQSPNLNSIRFSISL
jgi:hypothetical protein